MKTKKKLLILLSAIVLTATLIGCFALFSGAESVTPEMKITNCSLSFSDSVYIKYAVKTNVDDIKLLVWTEPQENYTIGTEKYTVTDHYSENIGGVSHEIFDLKELSAKMMTDNVYVRAYAKVGDTDYYSDPTKYSVLQYAYNKLGKTATASTSETLKTLLADMLTYGTSAQKHFNYKTTRLANADWYQVKLTAGTLDDGFAHGLYLEGDKVTLNAPETDTDGKTFDGWYNSADTKVASTNIATVTVGKKNEVYTPKYAATPSTPSYTEPTKCDHVFGEWTETKAATCTEDGERQRTCVNCSEKEIETIKASGHVEGDIIVDIEPTETAKGSGHTECVNCGKKIQENIPIDPIRDYTYTVNDDGTTCTVTGYKGTKNSITIPESINGYTVTAIGNKAFADCTQLTEINIPSTVKTIGTRAFYGCTGITEITIPESVTSIGTQIFYKATNLTTVNYYSSYYSSNNALLSTGSINKVVFKSIYTTKQMTNQCSNIKEVVLADGITSIGEYAFRGCTSLKSITIPDSVTSIGEYAFRGCTSLKSITIPDSVTSIDKDAFDGCTSLKTINYTGDIESWLKKHPISMNIYHFPTIHRSTSMANLLPML